MSDSPPDETGAPRDKRLQAALEDARDQQAARFDAVAEVHALAAARLNALAEDLAPVFAEVPDTNTSFICRVVPGDPPRLWIDMLAYVAIGSDGRSFEFIMNARDGRQILAESAEIKELSGCVVGYVAHRLIDLERSGVASPGRLSAISGSRFSGTIVALAWACGFAAGALFLFASAVMVGSGL